MVALNETTSEPGLRRAARGGRVTATYPQGGTGIPAGEMNYPGAAAHMRPAAATGFRAGDATSGFGLSPNALNINGADTYQFVGSDPVDAVDPWGLAGTPGALVPWGQQLQDVQILNSVLNGWYASGDLFAWRLLTAFLSNDFQSGHAGLTFEFAANEIKADPLYRETAQSYFRWFVANHGPGTHVLTRHWPTAHSAFNVEFYAEWGSDLMYALGGGHFEYTGGRVIVKKECTPLGTAYKWHTSGLEMVQRDYYSFPPGFLRTGTLGSFLFPAYGAAFDVQRAGFAKPFWHHETWHDHFSGVVYLNFPIAP